MSSVLLGAAPTADCTDRADGDAALVTVCFSVHAVAEPGVMPRVLELFAKRGLVPQKWHSTVSGTALAIDVQAGGLGRDTADYIARCMRQIVGVETVLTSETRFHG
jgi:acetolactate synthase small subunit